ncbi:MAG: YjgN family protein [Acidovorax temperans]|uniref:YjgN family protein n=1 Tax=Acidovorax temperans TaxID=80878 RepID=UPI003919D8BC
MHHNTQGGAAEQPSVFMSQNIEAYPMEFTGSGGEYFRVWIVNVLLGIVTLGFYTPWARRRTAMYFYGHSLVAHSPLEFTAQQRKMVLGFVLLALISIAYQIAAKTGQDLAVGLMLLAGAVLAPYLWASAMRFRLGATRWKGLRLQFSASWKEVYLASWPVFALALVWFGVFFGMQMLSPELAQALDGPAASGAPKVKPQFTAPMGALLGLGLLLSILCFIRLEYNYKSLLVLRARLGNEHGRWKPVYMDFVKVWLSTVAVFILCALLALTITTALLKESVAMFLVGHSGKNNLFWIITVVIIGISAFFFLLLLASAPARAYREARMFQLLWNNIGVSQIARFKCNLRAGRYVRLRLKNMVLTLLTLGFYRPFARVSEYRMKLESVTLHIKGGADQVAGVLVRQQEGGLGDALADAAGLDLIG